MNQPNEPLDTIARFMDRLAGLQEEFGLTITPSSWVDSRHRLAYRDAEGGWQHHAVPGFGPDDLRSAIAITQPLLGQRMITVDLSAEADAKMQDAFGELAVREQILALLKAKGRDIRIHPSFGTLAIFWPTGYSNGPYEGPWPPPPNYVTGMWLGLHDYEEPPEMLKALWRVYRAAYRLAENAQAGAEDITEHEQALEGLAAALSVVAARPDWCPGERPTGPSGDPYAADSLNPFGQPAAIGFVPDPSLSDLANVAAFTTWLAGMREKAVSDARA